MMNVQILGRTLLQLRNIKRVLQNAHYYTNEMEEGVPRITIPYHLKKKAKKVQKKVLKREMKEMQDRNPRRPVLISSSRPQLGSRVGDRFDPLNPVITSRGWRRRITGQDRAHFTIKATSTNPQVLNENSQYYKTFSECGVKDDIIRILKEKMDITTPTHIQTLAMPEILNDNCVICAADTGSGKTLAYLLPILEKILKEKNEELRDKPEETMKTYTRVRLRRSKNKSALTDTSDPGTLTEESTKFSSQSLHDGGGDKSHGLTHSEGDLTSVEYGDLTNTQQNVDGDLSEETDEEVTVDADRFESEFLEENQTEQRATNNSPYAIIIVPSRELVEQIQMVAEKFADELGIVVRNFLSGVGSMTRMKYLKREEMDVLIVTPGVLRTMLRSKKIFPSRLQHLVLDEADSLLDDSFIHDIKVIMGQLKIVTRRPVDEGGLPGLGVQISLVSATLPRKVENILGKIVEISHFKTVTTQGLHRLMPHVSHRFFRLNNSARAEEILVLAQQAQKRQTVTMIFCNKNKTSQWLAYYLEENGIRNMLLNSAIDNKERRGRFQQFQEAHHNILVCTDIASRGLDTIRVNHVINYEFPLFLSDYVHRAGRVGRVGSHGNGEVTSFVVYEWDVKLLWEIEKAARSSKAIENIDANAKRQITTYFKKKHGEGAHYDEDGGDEDEDDDDGNMTNSYSDHRDY